MCLSYSGSMKEHLPLLKETLKFMVNQLRADDRLSLISFDHEVSAKNAFDILKLVVAIILS